MLGKRRRVLANAPYNTRSVARAARGVATAAAGAYNAYRSFTTTRRKAPHSTYALTNQFDARRLYKRRSMPRYKRRRWVKFIKKVRATIPQTSRFAIYRNNSTALTTLDKQVAFGAVIYGVDPNNSSNGYSDINLVLDAATGENAGTNIQTRWTFKSAVLDLELNADGSNTVSLVVDCYEVVCRKNVAAAASAGAGGQNIGTSLSDLYYFGVNDLIKASTGSTLPTYDQPGVTPFQSPMFCQNFKILKKTRILLSPGQTAHMQLRDPRNRTLLYDRTNANLSFMKGWTKGYLVLFQGVVNSTDHSPVCRLNWAIDRTYTYTYLDPNTNTGQIV